MLDAHQRSVDRARDIRVVDHAQVGAPGAVRRRADPRPSHQDPDARRVAGRRDSLDRRARRAKSYISTMIPASTSSLELARRLTDGSHRRRPLRWSRRAWSCSTSRSCLIPTIQMASTARSVLRLQGAGQGLPYISQSDGGTTYTSVGETLVADTIGLATNTLGNWTGGNNFDETNHLDVALDDPDNELDSYSEDAVLNGAGGYLVGSAATGWEVFQAKTATLTAPGVYTLTGFLRGRYGTEWMMPLHGASETFIKLRPTININSPTGDLNATRKYKAVTLGMPLADADSEDFVNTGVALKPYSPVHLEGGRDASGNLTIQWMRRTRIGGVWLENVEVPLGETVEYYRIFIYSSNTYATVLREIYQSPNDVYTYTAADQTTDFGSTQATVYCGVVQGGAYGNGYETRGAL